MTQDREKLARLYETWEDEDLVRALTVERSEYVPEALAVIAAELASRGVTIEARRQAQTHGDPELHGIRGWLLLLVALLFCNSAVELLRALTLIVSLEHAERFVGAVVSAPQILFGGYGLYVSFLLVKKRSEGPRHARRWLFLNILLSVMILLLFFAGRVEWLAGLGNLVMSVVWIEYLDKSKRVASTYEEPSEIFEAEVFA